MGSTRADESILRRKHAFLRDPREGAARITPRHPNIQRVAANVQNLKNFEFFARQKRIFPVTPMVLFGCLGVSGAFCSCVFSADSNPFAVLSFAL